MFARFLASTYELVARAIFLLFLKARSPQLSIYRSHLKPELRVDFIYNIRYIAVYGFLPYSMGFNMTTTARFDLKMDIEEKEIVSRAAALVGTTMAAFVRTAAKDKARQLLDQESRITMTARDFEAFTLALNQAFTPNAALKNAMTEAREIKRA